MSPATAEATRVREWVSRPGPRCLGLIVLSALVVGCQSGPRGSYGPDAIIRQVEVINDNRSDVTVYAVVGGQRYRLGTVTAKLRASLEIPRVADLVSQNLYLHLDALGESYTIGPIVPMGGTRIDVVIAPRLVESRALVR